MHYNSLAIPSFTAAATLAVLLLTLLFGFRKNRQPVFCAMTACCFFYTLGNGLQLSSTSLNSALASYILKQAGIAGIGPFFLLFILGQTGVIIRLKSLFLPALWIIPIISMITLTAWPHSRLFFSEITMGNVMISTPGPAYWIFQVFLGICGTTGLVLLLRSIAFSQVETRQRLLIILCAALVPFAMYLLHMGQRLASGFDFTPVSFALTSLILYYGIRYKRFFDYKPLARTAIFERMADGAVIIEPSGRILDINPAAVKWLGPLKPGISVREIPLLQNITPANVPAQGLRFEKNITIDSQRHDLDITVSPFWETRTGEKSLICIMRDISGIREKERELEAIIDNSPVSIQLVDRNGYHLRHNPAFIQLFGGPPPSGISVFDIPDLIGIPEHIALLKKAQNGQTVHLPEFRFNHSHLNPAMPDKDLSLRIVIFPITDTGGKPEKFVLMHVDMTERLATENALHSSEELLRMAVEATNFDIWENNFVTGERNGTNRSLEAIGYTGENKLDTLDKVFARIHPDDTSRLNQALNDHFSGKTPLYQCEFRLHDPQGNWVWFENYGRVVEKDAEGHVTRFIGLTYNIDWRKQSEEKISREREQLEVTLRSIGEGVLSTDITGKITHMNPAAETLTGWKLEDTRGLLLPDIFLLSRTGSSGCTDPMRKVLASGIVHEENDTMLLAVRNGSHCMITYTASPLSDRNNRTTGVVIVFRDITERHRLLEHMQNNQKLESLGILAGGIAHDFNNLLSGIFGFIDLAAMTNTAPEIKEYLDQALGSMSRARGLTQQLLTFAKGGSPVRQPTLLSQLLIETVRFALSGSNVDCRFDIQDNIHPVNIDRDQIAQVIDNIIINAQQAMPEGGLVTIIAVNEHIPSSPKLYGGDYVRISFSDSGTGIPQEILGQIFDPFFTTKSQGQGLGLATSYSIMKRHDGHIEAESIPGQGSVFTIWLPASPELVINERTGNKKQFNGKGIILVMDDEEVVRAMLSRMLEKMGYTVLLAENGTQAKQIFSSEKNSGNSFAALIFDLTIAGGMGGIETLQQIRKLDPLVPVFVSSGYSADPVMTAPATYGFTASISKPFQMHELSSLLEEYLNHG